MALQIMSNNGGYISAKRDGAFLASVSGKKDFIIKGIGDQFKCTYATGSLIVTVGTGRALVCGRHAWEVAEDGSNTTIELPRNSTGYIAIRFDMTRPAGSEVYIGATLTIRTENINANGTYHDLALYKYVTGSDAITSLTDVRTYSKV